MAENLTEEQKMLEKPVKGYQLRELTNAVLEWKETTNKKLDEIADSVKTVATMSDLQSLKTELETEFEKKLDERDKAIHLKYGPTYKGIWWVVGSMGGGLIAMFWAMINNFWRGE